MTKEKLSADEKADLKKGKKELLHLARRAREKGALVELIINGQLVYSADTN